MDKEEWCKRFIIRMMDRAGRTHFDDGESILDYAHETSIACWEDEWQREAGPEAAADADMSYWGEE